MTVAMFSTSSIERPSSSLNKSNHQHDTENNLEIEHQLLIIKK